MGITKPALLTADHDPGGFNCKHEDLANWLKRHAFANQKSGASKTYVVCDDTGKSILGFYSLAPGAVSREAAAKGMTRNMPDPVPVILLGRLAVHSEWEGHGIGRGLLKDAVMRALQAASVIGGRAMLCHAIDDEAKAFYLHHGFLESPIQPLTVMLSLKSSDDSVLSKG